MTLVRQCEVEGCGRPHRAKGFCTPHYQRFCTHGDPKGGRPTSTARGEARAWLNAHKNFTGDDCLIWPFGRGQRGYGKIGAKRSTKFAHRLMCEYRHGPPPTAKHEAAHSCGRGHLGCVNPQHLSWKTRLENCADMQVHGTVIRGERQWKTKLTTVEVIAIRSSKGLSRKELAEKYGVHRFTIGNILRRSTWGWL